MGERKVLNKYFHPDLDPTRRLPKSQRVKNDPDKASSIRLMIPQSIRCSSCGAFCGAGTKLNATKEDAKDDYLKVKRFRFRFKCKECKAFITMLTDPQNAGYEMESGATFNYSMSREKQSEVKADQDKAAGNDSLGALEKRTLDSQREMEEIDRLEELARRNRVRNAASVTTLAPVHEGQGQEILLEEQEEDEEFVRKALAQKHELGKVEAQAEVDLYEAGRGNAEKHNDGDDDGLIVLGKRKREKKKKKRKKKRRENAGLGLAYGSDSDSDSG